MHKYYLIIVLLTLFSCSHKENPKKELLESYMENTVGEELQDSSNILVITYAGCKGCVQKGINYLILHPKVAKGLTKIIFSSELASHFPEVLELKGNVFQDTTNRIEVLSLGLSGYTLFQLNNGAFSLKRLDIRFTSDEGLHAFFGQGALVLQENKDIISNSSFISLNKDSFDSLIGKAVNDSICSLERPIIIFFESEHCAPCKKMKPFLDSISTTKQGIIKSYLVNFSYKDNMLIYNKYKNIEKYNLRCTPTIWLLQNGHKVKIYEGYYNKQQLDSLFNQILLYRQK